MMTHSLILIWAHLLWSQVIFECKNIVWNGTQHTWKHLQRISDHKAEKTPCGVAHYRKWFHSVVEQFLRIWCVADFSCLIFIHATFRGPTMALLHGQKLLSLVASFDSKNLLFFWGQRTRKVAALQRLILFESRCFVGDRQKQPTHTHSQMFWASGKCRQKGNGSENSSLIARGKSEMTLFRFCVTLLRALFLRW